MKATVQVFLSYAREDERKVEKLYQRLSDAGFKPWMDKKDILPGERWKSSIQKAVRRSDFFLVCLSENSVSKRGFLQKEIRDALDVWQEMLDSDIYLIPVRLEDCEMPESLRDFQWVNLFEKDGWGHLVKAIRVGMERRGEIIKPSKSREAKIGAELTEQGILEALHEAELTCPEGLTEQELSTRLGISVNVLHGYLLRLGKDGYVKSVEVAKGVGGIPHGIQLWCITREGAQALRDARRPAEAGGVRVEGVQDSIIVIGSEVTGSRLSIDQGEKADSYGGGIDLDEMNEREHLQTLLKTHRRNLQKMEIQQAGYGALDVPLSLLNQIEAERQKIAEIEAKLAELDAQAEE